MFVYLCPFDFSARAVSASTISLLPFEIVSSQVPFLCGFSPLEVAGFANVLNFSRLLVSPPVDTWRCRWILLGRSAWPERTLGQLVLLTSMLGKRAAHLLGISLLQGLYRRFECLGCLGVGCARWEGQRFADSDRN